jgi:hypothetical protein
MVVLSVTRINKRQGIKMMRSTGNISGLRIGMLSSIPLLLFACAHAEPRLTPEVLQERMLRPDRPLSLCEFNLLNAAGSGSSAMLGLVGAIYDANKAQKDAPYATALAAEFSGIYEGVLTGAGTFPYLPRAKLAQSPDGKPMPMEAVVNGNGLHACVAAKSSLLVLVGWSKKVSVSTVWELTGRSGWKMTIETEAISQEAQGVFPDTADPKLRPVFVGLARESVAMFLASLAERGMVPAGPPAAPAPAPAVPAGAAPQAPAPVTSP